MKSLVKQIFPFGTEMSAISIRSLPSYAPNRYKANSGAEYAEQEWANGSGLGPDSYREYETFRHGGQVYRSYNAQNLSREAKRIGIGRFLQGDPMMETTVSMSGYLFSGNNPVMFTDLLGDRKDPGHYGYWPPPFYFRSNYYSYMDGNGNKWHHEDILAGTALEGIPYTEGWGSDGFGDMMTGPGGGAQGVQISWGTYNGVEGYNIYWWEKGEQEHGKTLEELKLAMTFKPFSFEMQWNRWEYGMQRNKGNNWENAIKTTGTINDVFGAGYSTTEAITGGAIILTNKMDKASDVMKGVKIIRNVPAIGVVGTVSEVLDVGLDLYNGDFGKATLKGGYSLLKNTIRFSSPIGFAAITLFDIGMAVYDLYNDENDD